MVHPIFILTVDSNSSKNRKEAFYIMDGRTERSEIFVYEGVTNIIFSYRWHKSHFYAGGTNVIF
jgi:hypothetical protein